MPSPQDYAEPKSYTSDNLLMDAFDGSGIGIRACALSANRYTFSFDGRREDHSGYIFDATERFHRTLASWYFLTPCMWAEIYIQAINSINMFNTPAAQRILLDAGYLQPKGKRAINDLQTIDEFKIGAQFANELGHINNGEKENVETLDEIKALLEPIRRNPRQYGKFDGNVAMQLRGSESFNWVLNILCSIAKHLETTGYLKKQSIPDPFPTGRQDNLHFMLPYYSHDHYHVSTTHIVRSTVDRDFLANVVYDDTTTKMFNYMLVLSNFAGLSTQSYLAQLEASMRGFNQGKIADFDYSGVLDTFLRSERAKFGRDQLARTGFGNNFEGRHVSAMNLALCEEEVRDFVERHGPRPTPTFGGLPSDSDIEIDEGRTTVGGDVTYIKTQYGEAAEVQYAGGGKSIVFPGFNTAPDPTPTQLYAKWDVKGESKYVPKYTKQSMGLVGYGMPMAIDDSDVEMEDVETTSYLPLALLAGAAVVAYNY